MQDTRHIPIENEVSEAALYELVIGHYAIRPVAIAPLGGYSNLNYGITDAAGGRYVLRISGGNRAAASAAAELYVLRWLEKGGYALAPRVISPEEGTGTDGAAAPEMDEPLRVEFQGMERYVQLSDMIPGSIECFWWQQCSIDKIEQIFRGLAHLHRAMAAIPALHELSAPAFRYTLPEQAPALLQATPTGQYVFDRWQVFRQSAIRLQMDMADRYPWQDARYQWIHGDVQLENLLFDKGYLTGFLDFERVSWDACEKDMLFSAFRVCKEGNTDAPFEYDRGRFDKAIEAYRATDREIYREAGKGGVCDLFFSGYEEWWKPFFCLDQAMVYLENAFDGTWQLAEGIGFLPCFNEVLHYKLN